MQRLSSLRLTVTSWSIQETLHLVQQASWRLEVEKPEGLSSDCLQTPGHGVWGEAPRTSYTWAAVWPPSSCGGHLLQLGLASASATCVLSRTIGWGHLR